MRMVQVKSIFRDEYDSLSKSDKALKMYVEEPRWGSVDVEKNFSDLLENYPLERNTTVYRGLNFNTEEEYNEFMDSIKNNVITNKRFSSWTRNKGTARQFAESKPTYHLELMTKEDRKALTKNPNGVAGYCGVLLKTIAKKDKCIDVNDSEWGREDEILIPAGKIRLKSIEKITERARDKNNINISGDMEQDFNNLRKSKDGYFSNNLKNFIARYKPDDVSEEVKEYIFRKTCTLSEMKYTVSVTEFSRDFPYLKIKGMGINPKYFAYYPENKKDKIIRLLKARLPKFFKEFKSKYVENCEIDGLEKIGYLVDLVGLTYPFKKLIQDTLVEEYHKLTEWRAIKNTNEIDKERIQYIISLIPKVIKR